MLFGYLSGIDVLIFCKCRYFYGTLHIYIFVLATGVCDFLWFYLFCFVMVFMSQIQPIVFFMLLYSSLVKVLYVVQPQVHLP